MSSQSMCCDSLIIMAPTRIRMGAVAAFGTCSRERQQLQVKSLGQGPPACPAEAGGGESHLGEERREEDGEEEEQPHRHGRQPRAPPATDAGR